LRLAEDITKIKTKPRLSIDEKIEIENLIKKDNQIFEPNVAFKKSTFTGNLCHIVWDQLYFSGVMSNFLSTSPENYNTLEQF